MISDEAERREPSRAEALSSETDQVRAVMEHTREALDSSAAELERAKRLLRETATLVDRGAPADDETSDDGSSSS